MAITQIQNIRNGATAANSASGTFGSTPVQGNVLIVSIALANASVSVSSLSQTGVTWHQDYDSGSGSSPRNVIYRGDVGANPGAGLTINLSGSTDVSFNASEWSGLDDVIDQTQTNSNNTTLPSTNTPAYDPELLYCSEAAGCSIGLYSGGSYFHSSDQQNGGTANNQLYYISTGNSNPTPGSVIMNCGGNIKFAVIGYKGLTTSSQTLTGKANIQATTPQTLSGKADVKQTTQQTLMGKAAINIIHGPLQSAEGDCGGGVATSITVTLPSAPTQNNVLLLWLYGANQPNCTLSQTGVTWSNILFDSPSSVGLWLGVVGANAGTTLTVTFNSTTTGIGHMSEWSGISTLQPDQSVPSNGNTTATFSTSTNPQTQTMLANTSGTTQRSNELVMFAWFEGGLSGSPSQRSYGSPSAGYTKLTENESFDSMASVVYYQVVAATGTYTCSVPLTAIWSPAGFGPSTAALYGNGVTLFPSTRQGLTGVSNIQNTIQQTLTGKANIKNTTQQTLTGKAAINVIQRVTHQSNSADNVNVSSFSITVPAPTDGDLLLLGINMTNSISGHPAITGISQSGANWQPTGIVQDGSTDGELWCAQNVKNAGTTITINVSPNVTDWQTCYAEYKTVNGTILELDQTATNIGSLSGGTADTGTTPTTQFPNELLFGFIGTYAGAPTSHLASPTNGFSIVDELDNNDGLHSYSAASLDKIVNVTGTADSTMTYTHSGSLAFSAYEGMMATFAPFSTSSQTLTGKAFINTFVTTTQTLLGKGDIQNTSVQTLDGKSNIKNTSSQSLTGKADVLNTTIQNLLGKSNLKTTTSQTLAGKSNLQNTTDQTLSGHSNIYNTSSKTISGKGDIQQLAVQKTLTGKASILETQSQVLSGVSNIRNSTQQLLSGKANLKNTTQQALTAKSNIKNTTAQNLSGIANIRNTTDQALTGKGDIKKSASQTLSGVSNIKSTTQQSLSGKANISTFMTTTRTLTGVSNLRNTSHQTLSGVGNIRKTSPQTLTGKANLRNTSQHTLSGVANLKNTTQQMLTGKGDVKKTTAQTLTGKANIKKSTKKTLTGKADVKKTTSQTLSGKSNLRNTTQHTLSGVANLKATTQQMLSGKANITTFTTTTRTLTGKANLRTTTSQTLSGKSNIKNTTKQTLSGVANLKNTSPQSLSGKASVKNTSTQTISGKANLAITSTQTLAGKSNIKASTSRTLAGVANVKNTTAQALNGKADVKQSAVQKTLTGTSNLKATSSRNLSGVSNLKNTTQQALPGKASVKQTTQQMLSGKAALQYTTQQSLTGKANLKKTSGQTLSGKGSVKQTTSQTLFGKSSIVFTSIQTLTGKSNIKVSTDQTITGKANIKATTQRFLTGVSRIGTIPVVSPILILNAPLYPSETFSGLLFPIETYNALLTINEFG